MQTGQVARKQGLGLGLNTGNQELRLGLEAENIGLRLETGRRQNCSRQKTGLNNRKQAATEKQHKCVRSGLRHS